MSTAVSLSQPEVIYDEELRCVGEGTALFQPDPYDEYPILELGDGGYTMKGKFVPRWKMPGWDSNPPKPVKRSLHVPEPLHSRTVREIEAGVSIQTGPGIPTTGGVSIQYACSTTRGALLSLHDKRMESRDLDERTKAELELYAIDNIQEILDECGLRNVGRLAIITGTTMTGNWDAVAFSGESQHGSAQANISSFAQINASVSVRYSHNQTAHRSTGHLHSPGVNCTTECATRKNQCVFIRRLLIGTRMHRHWRKVRLSVNTTLSSRLRQRGSSRSPPSANRDSGSSEQPSPTSGCPHDEFKLPDNVRHCESSLSPVASSMPDEEYDHDDEIGQSLEQEIFDWIFEHSKAEKAVLYEDDIDRWILSDGEGLRIDVDIHGVGRLVEVQEIFSPRTSQLQSVIAATSSETLFDLPNPIDNEEKASGASIPSEVVTWNADGCEPSPKPDQTTSILTAPETKASAWTSVLNIGKRGYGGISRFIDGIRRKWSNSFDNHHREEQRDAEGDRTALEGRKKALGSTDPNALEIESDGISVPQKLKRWLNTLGNSFCLPDTQQRMLPRADPSDKMRALGAHTWVVLIAVTEYEDNGLEHFNDSGTGADELKKYFQVHLGVPESHIRLLKGKASTRVGILNALYSHLRDNENVSEGDNLVIWFGGHGITYPESKATGKEYLALCPADRGSQSNDGLVPDISCRELNIFLRELRDSKGSRITVILDCCQATGAARGFCPNTGPVYIPPTLPLEAADKDPRRRDIRKANCPDWEPDMTTHVLLCSSGACERFYEPRLTSYHSGGLFTTTLVRILKSLNVRIALPTYEEVINQIGQLNANPGIQTKVMGINKTRRVWFTDIVRKV